MWVGMHDDSKHGVSESNEASQSESIRGDFYSFLNPFGFFTN